MYNFPMRRPRQRITEHARATKAGEIRDEIQMICRDASPSFPGGGVGGGGGGGGRRGEGRGARRWCVGAKKTIVFLKELCRFIKPGLTPEELGKLKA